MVDESGGEHRPQIQTLVASDLVDSTRLVEVLGDRAAAALFAEHDRLARELLTIYRGLEIDKSDGFLLLFERPIEATRYALAYHDALERLSAERLAVGQEFELTARVAVHLGEVILRHNPKDEVARGAKPIEVEGLAKPTVFRVASVALPRQTLLTGPAFSMARRSSAEVDTDLPLAWLAHGNFLVKGIAEPVEVFEAAIPGRSPMALPVDSEKAQRVAEDGAILG